MRVLRNAQLRRLDVSLSLSLLHADSFPIMKPKLSSWSVQFLESRISQTVVPANRFLETWPPRPANYESAEKSWEVLVDTLGFAESRIVNFCSRLCPLTDCEILEIRRLIKYDRSQFPSACHRLTLGLRNAKSDYFALLCQNDKNTIPTFLPKEIYLLNNFSSMHPCNLDILKLKTYDRRTYFYYYSGIIFYRTCIKYQHTFALKEN